MAEGKAGEPKAKVAKRSTSRPTSGRVEVGGLPFELAFDSANGILYSASWGSALLALKVKR